MQVQVGDIPRYEAALHPGTGEMGRDTQGFMQKEREQKILPTSAVSQLSSAQSNQHAKAAYLGRPLIPFGMGVDQGTENHCVDKGLDGSVLKARTMGLRQQGLSLL